MKSIHYDTQEHKKKVENAIFVEKYVQISGRNAIYIGGNAKN